MKPLRNALALVLAACIVTGQVSARAQGLIEPLSWPAGGVCGGRVTVVWQDLYQERDAGAGARYRITVRNASGKDEPPATAVVDPRSYFGVFYAYSMPGPLAAGTYEYTIERLVDNDPVTTRRYHYLRYPLRQSFTVDPAARDILCELPPDYLIRYLQLDRENTLANGYNALFFAGASVLSFGICMLFYAVLHFGIVSTIIYSLAFISAASGVFASGYYAWRYWTNLGRLEKIVEIGRGVSLQGAAVKNGTALAAQLRY